MKRHHKECENTSLRMRYLQAINKGFVFISHLEKQTTQLKNE